MKLVVNQTATLLLAALSVSTFASCAATLDTKMQTLVPGVRLDPPGKNENKVYLVFTDQTGEGAEFEERVYEAICDRVQEKGYDIVNSDEADFVMWATLRVFDKVGKEDGNKVLAGLGGIAGGAATGIALNELTENGTVAWLGGAAAGTGTAMVIEKFTEKDHWAMVIDLQLGRRLKEAAKQTIKVEDQSRIQSTTISGIQSGIVGSVEGGASSQGVTKSTEVVQEKIFLELEQRILAQATSRSKSKEEVAEALIEKISNGLSGHLPPYHRGNGD